MSICLHFPQRASVFRPKCSWGSRLVCYGPRGWGLGRTSRCCHTAVVEVFLHNTHTSIILLLFSLSFTNARICEVSHSRCVTQSCFKPACPSLGMRNWMYGLTFCQGKEDGQLSTKLEFPLKTGLQGLCKAMHWSLACFFAQHNERTFVTQLLGPWIQTPLSMNGFL